MARRGMRPLAQPLVASLVLLLAACSSAGQGVDDAAVEEEEGAAGGGSAGASGGGGSAGASGVNGGAGGAKAGAAGAGAGTGGASGASAGGAGASAGGAGGAGTAGASAGGAGAGSGGKAGACADAGPEPNDSEALATPACGTPCELSDKDTDGSAAYGGSIKAIAGTVGPGDADHYVFHGKDTFGIGHVVDPAAKTQQSGFRLCVFTACPGNETTKFSCSSGTQVKSPGGLDGCCAQAPGEARSDHDCKGSITDDDSADVIIRVDQATMCVDYLVDFHF